MFKSYIEWLTKTERIEAFRGGQTNLDPKYNMANDDIYYKGYNALRGNEYETNPSDFLPSKDYRGVLTDSNLYVIDAGTNVHDAILETLAAHKKLFIEMSELKADFALNFQDSSWHRPGRSWDSLDYFLCIQSSPRMVQKIKEWIKNKKLIEAIDSKYLFFGSESYLEGKLNSPKIKNYQNMLKRIYPNGNVILVPIAVRNDYAFGHNSWEMQDVINEVIKAIK